jgi:hypothetical protein
MTLSPKSKIYVAGHSAATAATKRPEQYHSTTVVYAVEAGFSEEWYTGLVGSAILRRLESGGYSNLVVRDLTELDLTDPTATADFFQDEKPEFVFLAAAPLRTRCRKKHGQGRRHPRQRHLSGRLHPDQPAGPAQQIPVAPGVLRKAEMTRLDLGGGLRHRKRSAAWNIIQQTFVQYPAVCCLVRPAMKLRGCCHA